MRKSDSGGDEFGLLLMGCPTPEAEPVARSLIESLRDYAFVWGDRTFKVGC